MPVVKITTNIADKDVPAKFEERLTDVLMESMKKPRSRFSIEVFAGARILHGGNHSPVAIIEIESIGSMSSQENIRHTQKITQLCEDVLHLPNERIIISYFDMSPANVSCAGRTVAATIV